MYAMFSDCSSIEKLNLCSFNTLNTTQMGAMFQNATKLKSIYVGSNWTTENASTTNMFTSSGVSEVTQSDNCEYDAEEMSLEISTTSTTNSITVVATAHADSGIAKYEYSKDGGKTWEESTNNTYIFTGLTAGTAYDIKVRVTSNIGKILEKGTNVDITNNVVTTGAGLYEDEYEDGRYIYRGQNPDNYIWFNDELWRIIAKETDGTYKIIKNDVLANRAFDEANHRSTENNSYCTNPSSGCGVYAAVEGEFSSPSGSQSGTVTEDSSIKIYLNDDYYVNNINSTAKGQMISHSFNIGAVEYLDESGAETDSIEKNIAGEKMYTWTGNVGLVNVSDILRASTNPLCTSASTSYNGINKCNSNYLLDKVSVSALRHWTINASSRESGGYSTQVWYGSVNSSDAFVYSYYAYYSPSFAPRPVVFLKSDITLSGSGTQSNPYQINKISTSTLETPTFMETGTYGKTVTITYPSGCGDSLTCTYQKDNGEVVNVTEGTVDVEFSVDGNIVATVSDGTNTVSRNSYAVDVTNASDQLEAKVVTTGQGIYDDIYEENHYVYKGANPDNYIRFNNELWRIISTEQDDTIKIIRNESLGEMVYDEPGSRNSTTNTGTYCISDNGCNAYGITNNFNGLGTVLKDSTLNTYLNGKFYNGLTSDAKLYIIDHDFPNYGPGGNGVIGGDKTYIDKAVESERQVIWHGNIGLMNLTDFLRGTLDSACDSVYSGWQISGYPCHNDNYLYKDGELITTMTTWTYGLENEVWTVNTNYNNGGICSGGTDCGWVYLEQSIYPVLYLRNTIYLTGSGTESSPYIIHDILS